MLGLSILIHVSSFAEFTKQKHHQNFFLTSSASPRTPLISPSVSPPILLSTSACSYTPEKQEVDSLRLPSASHQSGAAPRCSMSPCHSQTRARADLLWGRGVVMKAPSETTAGSCVPKQRGLDPKHRRARRLARSAGVSLLPDDTFVFLSSSEDEETFSVVLLQLSFSICINLFTF